MSAVLDYMQLCRLCLVKDKVNVPIFGDTNDLRQIFLKITACLPIKVSEDDNLPKKICDACLYKVDLLYQFWNTTVNAEKQLIQWLGEIGIDVNLKSGDPTPIQIQSHAHPHSIHTEIMLKEEGHDSESKPAENYVPTQQIVYGSYSQQFPQPTDTVNAEIGNTVTPAATLDSTNNFSQAAPVVNEMKRARTRQATKKLQQTAPVSTSISTTVTSPAAESMDEDSNDRIGAPDDSDDSMVDTGDRIAKEEAESEEEYDENVESLEPTTFVGVPSTPALCDSEQPGPSGLSKQTAATTDRGFQQGMKNNHVYGQSDASIKLPFAVWENNNQNISESFDTMTIKVEPIDLDWEDDLPLLNLKNKLGLMAKKKKKRARKPVVKNAIRKSQKNVCVICEEVVRGRSSLINHYLLHKDECIKRNMELISKSEDNDFLRCCVCMKEFTIKSDLEKHAEYHIERPFFCEKCNKSFKQSQNFLTHMSSHQPSKVGMKCEECGFSTTFKLAYDKHVKSHGREEYRCDLCDKVFPARTWFLEHKNYHTGERPFSCEECGKCFPYSRYLTAHKKSMHPHCYFREPELNECHICKKRYSHKNSLRLHMKSHTGENSYLCDVCGKSLSSTDKLQLHKRIHTGYKPYSCTICEKSFTKKDILTDHMRVHSGEKPFACETCGKCFSQRSPLTIHRRYHTGERPYVCHLCNKGFVSKGILGIHLKQGKH